MKKIILLLFALWFSSCSVSKKVISKNKEYSPKKVIRNINKATNQINYLQAKAKVSFVNNNKKKSNTVTYRLSVNEKLWVNATLGAVRILIDNDSIKYYNKLERNYFISDFDFINDQIGISADFDILQNLILGMLMQKLEFSSYFDKKEGNYIFKKEIDFGQKKVESLIHVSASDFRIYQQSFTESNNKFIVFYSDYKKLKEQYIPTKIRFINNGDESFNIEIKSFSAPEKLNTPFKIPKNFKQTNL